MRRSVDIVRPGVPRAARSAANPPCPTVRGPERIQQLAAIDPFHAGERWARMRRVDLVPA